MKQATYIVCALVVIAAIAFWVWRQQRQMIAALPPRVVCVDRDDARARAGLDAVAILGTGSMAPLIPAAKAGQDPKTTVVAYVKPSDKTYDEIRRGDLVIYWADWARGWVCHQAAQQDGDGWIMSGLNNRESESFARVTVRNFRAVVLNVYVWPF